MELLSADITVKAVGTSTYQLNLKESPSGYYIEYAKLGIHGLRQGEKVLDYGIITHIFDHTMQELEGN